MLTIAFQNPQLDVRGSCQALYDYAHNNEKILENKSIIVVPKQNKHKNDYQAVIKFSKRFPVFYYDNVTELEKILKTQDCKAIYYIKYGKNDHPLPKNVKVFIHCVFDCSEPHGDVYAAVSHALAKKFNYNLYVPHMVGILPGQKKNNMRKMLNIPKDAIVFGRHGGMDTFDLKFCHQVIETVVKNREDVYFVFVNTPRFSNHPQVINLGKIVDVDEKNRFINTCDAHLECGSLGHSFGLSMGEFSVNNKPIIAYGGNVWNTAHFEILGEKALYFRNASEFIDILLKFDPKDWEQKDNNCYRDYTPEKVMKIFSEVFLEHL